MNFFCVGFFLLGIQLNFQSIFNYIIKFIGFLFLVGGIWEMEGYKKDYNKFYKPTIFATIWSVLSIIIVAVLNRFDNSKICIQSSEVFLGSFLTIAMLLIEMRIIKQFDCDSELKAKTIELDKLKNSWNKFAFFTVLGVIFNIFNIVPVNSIMNISALAMAISRIIMYVFALIVTVKIIKIRNDYYR